jgi:four helix bundle protein
MSDGARNYRGLIVWQAAMQMVEDVECVCARLPRKDWDLARQMRRSSTSVPENIAEGNGRFSIPDYLRFLGTAKASLNELQSDLQSLRRRDPKDRLVATALNRSYFVEKTLMRLVKSLRRKRDGDAA